MPKKPTTPGRDSLYAAIARDDLGSVRNLLAAGTDPNGVDEIGDVTPLMSAAARGNAQVVEILLGAGAYPDAIAEDLSGDLDAFPFLERLYQNAEIRGLTALAYAELFGRSEVAALIRPRTSEPLRREAAAVREARHTLGGRLPRKSRRTARAGPRNASLKAAELTAAHPRLARWINSCVLCGRAGYKPDLPVEIDRQGSAELLRRNLRPLAATDSLCDECSRKGEERIAAARARRR